MVHPALRLRWLAGTGGSAARSTGDMEDTGGITAGMYHTPPTRRTDSTGNTGTTVRRPHALKS